jgi:hypothetical protein
MWLDDVLILDNGGSHGELKKCALVSDLKAGEHKVKVYCIKYLEDLCASLKI